MKTIDEALGLFMAWAPTPEARDQKVLEMKSDIERREGVASEVGHNPMVREFVEQCIVTMGEEIDYDVTSLALSMFINGVLIGMEMEREELGEIRTPETE